MNEKRPVYAGLFSIIAVQVVCYNLGPRGGVAQPSGALQSSFGRVQVFCARIEMGCRTGAEVSVSICILQAAHSVRMMSGR